MSIWWLVPVGAAMAAALTLWRGARVFRAHVDAMAGRLADGPALGPNAALPVPVAAAAHAAGAGEGPPVRAVRLMQRAELRLAAGKPFRRCDAVQTIGCAAPGFVWDAVMPGPGIPKLRVLDAFVGGGGVLEARLLGAVRVARAAGPVTDRSEAMRYLAELPWAPDAMLCNPQIDWRIDADGWIAAGLEVGSGRVEVRFRREGADIVEMRADGRPDIGADGTVTLRNWQGHYRDHGWIGGRRVPRYGEVGYVGPDGYAPYWRGRIVEYHILR